MSDENQEEEAPQTNASEEETPEESEDTPNPQEKPKEASDEPSDKEKRLYARLKKEEEARKKAEQALSEAKKQADPTDVDKILATTRATAGLSDAEIAELKLRADATGKSLLEARNDENYKIWQNAYKRKVEEEQAPSPSTKQGTEEPQSVKFDSLTPQEKKQALDNMSDDEVEKWLDGMKIKGVPIEQLEGMESKGIEAFKKEKSPRPIDEDSIRVGENPQIR